MFLFFPFRFFSEVAGSIIIASAYSVSAAKRAQQQGDFDNAAVDTIPGDDGTDNGENDTDGTGATPDSAAVATPDSAAETTAATERGATGQGTNTQGVSISWRWNDDGTAVLVVTDSSGKVIGEVDATVTTTEEPAKCTSNGRLTYSASASWDGQTYTDTRIETLSALGHEFDSGIETILENGDTAMDFECTRCHEHFVVRNSITEE